MAELMDVPTYFITALKFGKKYKIFLEKQSDLSEKNLANNFGNYLERLIIMEPYQFYHFYDFFE